MRRRHAEKHCPPRARPLERLAFGERPPGAALLGFVRVAERVDRFARSRDRGGAVALVGRDLRLLDAELREVDGIGRRAEQRLRLLEVGHRVRALALEPHDPGAEQVGAREVVRVLGRLEQGDRTPS